MNYEISPLEGVRGIRFGMNFQAVRSLVGIDFKSFKRTASAVFPCDHFSEAGVFAYYDANGALEALELAEPAAPTFDGVNLLGLSFESVLALLESKDASVSKEADGAISLALGVSVYAPQALKDPTANCESVVVFKRGYYD
ncbi:ABC transporter ATP-binding protein [Dyella acidiphila]|uniref:ABC transporter ATP-binding protein n=1 Tax=Dyella acidiphila TaxID=2775866 RepID=A0ABR9GFE6_9GAMM|nr:ABC transporter ATP-binding protein [Dyella acidiphila]MBE1162757.1 ABC transporter ATP-binding protein [Dyella acidiphila]